MPTSGIVLTFDEVWRKTEQCAVCKEVIGGEEFILFIQLQPPTGKTDAVHKRCGAVTFAELAGEIVEKQNSMAYGPVDGLSTAAVTEPPPVGKSSC